MQWTQIKNLATMTVKQPIQRHGKWSPQGRTVYKTYKGNLKYKRAAASQLSLGLLFLRRRS